MPIKTSETPSRKRLGVMANRCRHLFAVDQRRKRRWLKLARIAREQGRIARPMPRASRTVAKQRVEFLRLHSLLERVARSRSPA